MRRFAILLFAFIALPLAAQEKPREVTPDDLWNALAQGNKQFMAGKITYDDLKGERAQFGKTQLPPVTVLACSDSRVPPELVFNQSLGALFVVRVAGNVPDEFGLASIEFAIAKNYTRLIVVLGHENCDAVQAALGGADPSTPSLLSLAKRIRSSFLDVPYNSRDAANVKRAVEANTKAAAAQLLAGSILIRDAVATEKIKIIPAYYDLDTGEVKKIE